MTWSIVARDSETGALGVAVASRFFAVGALVPHIRPHRAAVATQAFVNPLWGIEAADRMAAGEAAAKVLAENYRLLDRTPLRLGILSTIGHVRLARFLARLETAHAGIELAVSEGSMNHLRQELEAGRLDAAILTSTEALAAALRLQELYEERYVVVLPAQHRLRAMNAIRLHDLSGEDYVDRLSCDMREMVMQVCEGEGVKLYARFRSEREDWVQAMVTAGIGFAFMPEYSVTLPGLVQRPLIEPEVTRKVALATVPGRKHAPAMAALARAAQTYAWPG